MARLAMQPQQHSCIRHGHTSHCTPHMLAFIFMVAHDKVFGQSDIAKYDFTLGKSMTTKLQCKSGQL